MSGDSSDLKEPKRLTAEQIFKDLQEAGDDDPLASDDVKTILAELDPLYCGGKWETYKSKAFETTEKILQVRADLLLKKEILLKKSGELNDQFKELEELGKSVKKEADL